MKTNEIIEYYNTLSNYAKNRVVTLVKDLYSAQEESRSYCIKVCPKCGAIEPAFTKGEVLPMVVSRCSDVLYVRNGLLLIEDSLLSTLTRMKISGIS